MRFAVPALAAFILLYAAASHAQQLDPWQIVGHTTTTHLGGEGLRAFTLACQADYGAAARTCTSQEVIDTISWPTLTLRSRVRPSFQPIASGTTSAKALDASGYEAAAYNMNCGGWSFSSPSFTGVQVTPDGSFPSFSQDLTACDVAMPVACCRRVPEPTASLMLPVGGLACLGLAKARS
jgi:hypothetical protein